jgi:hypothetical protein
MNTVKGVKAAFKALPGMVCTRTKGDRNGFEATAYCTNAIGTARLMQASRRGGKQ